MSIQSEIDRLNATKKAIKNAIIGKGQSVADTDPFSSYADKISAIDTLASGTADATAAAGDILSGKTAYVKGAKVTGNIASKGASNLTANGKTVTVPAGYYPSQVTKDVATATQATPSISVSSAGLITASAEQDEGYVSEGTKSATKQLTTQAAKTITPGTSGQTAIAEGVFATGAVTVAGDANLVPANIVEGRTIFGKAGTAEPASALAGELSEQDTLIANIMTALEGKTAGGGANFETVTITEATITGGGVHTLYYTNANGEFATAEVVGNSVAVAKNTIVCVKASNPASREYAFTGSRTVLFSSSECFVFVPTTDGGVGYEK